MQFQVSKKTLQQQVRPPIREKKLKNQDRILYVKGLFNPPPTETHESVMGTKVLDQWRNVLSLGVLTAFLMLMMMVSIIGDYGILSSHQLQERKEILEQNIKDLKNKEVLMREEIHALKNSPTFIAAVARRELGWVKENDHLPNLQPAAVVLDELAVVEDVQVALRVVYHRASAPLRERQELVEQPRRIRGRRTRRG